MSFLKLSILAYGKSWIQKELRLSITASDGWLSCWLKSLVFAKLWPFGTTFYPMKATNDTFTYILVVWLFLKSENNKSLEVILLQSCHCYKNLEMLKSFSWLSAQTKFMINSVK